MALKKRTSLQEVADHIGITKMTVSRYLKNPSLVAEKTGVKIAEALELLNYIPNRAPDMLPNSRSYAFGVLVPSLSNQVFTDVVRGIEEVAEAANYQCMLAHYGYNQSIEEKRIEYLLSYHVDALLLCENHHSPYCQRLLASANIPVIEMMDVVSSPSALAVGFDNEKAAYQMVKTLHQQGYKQVVYLAAQMDARTLARQSGYERAQVHSKQTCITISTKNSSSISEGKVLMAKVLQEYPQADAVFCTNDDLAAGAVFECLSRGISIPSTIAVAGFHGHEFGQQMTPQLASVITPRYLMGQQAAQLALQMIKKPDIQASSIVLPVSVSLGATIRVWA